MEPVELSYHDEGTGPALLFLHGGGCDRTFWDAQVVHFRGRFRLIVPDLRGHGKSPAPPGDYPISAFADDVAALADALGVRGATVVGHSLGGLVAFLLPALHPGVAGRVVALDSPLVLPDEAAAVFQQLADEPPETFRSAASAMSAATTDPALHAKIAGAQDATDLRAFMSLTRHVFTNTYADLIGRCAVPALSVNAVMPNDISRLESLCAGFQWGRVVGSGHFLQMEVPDQVNAMLERFFSTTDA